MIVRVPHLYHHQVVGEVEVAARQQAIPRRVEVRVHAVVGVVEDGQDGRRDHRRGEVQAEGGLGAGDAPDGVGAGGKERGRGAGGRVGVVGVGGGFSGGGLVVWDAAGGLERGGRLR